MSNRPDARRIRENYKMLGNAVMDLRECILFLVCIGFLLKTPPRFFVKTQTKAGRVDVIEFLLEKYPEEGPGSLSNMKVCPSLFESSMSAQITVANAQQPVDVSYHRGIFIYIAFHQSYRWQTWTGTSMRASDRARPTKPPQGWWWKGREGTRSCHILYAWCKGSGGCWPFRRWTRRYSLLG